MGPERIVEEAMGQMRQIVMLLECKKVVGEITNHWMDALSGITCHVTRASVKDQYYSEANSRRFFLHVFFFFLFINSGAVQEFANLFVPYDARKLPQR